MTATLKRVKVLKICEQMNWMNNTRTVIKIDHYNPPESHRSFHENPGKIIAYCTMYMFPTQNLC